MFERTELRSPARVELMTRHRPASCGKPPQHTWPRADASGISPCQRQARIL